MINNKIRKFIAVIIVLLSFAGCGHADANKKKVVIYTSMYEDVADNMTKILNDKFPEYNIQLLSAGTGVIQAKVAAETTTGKLGCDMLILAEPSYAMELKEKNMLQPIKIKNADKLLFDYDKDGYWYPVRALNMVLAYNPEKKKLNQVPNSFEEFSKAEDIKGKLSMPNPLISGSVMATVEGLLSKYGEKFFEDLGKLEIPVESGEVAVTKLETGEADVIMTLEQTILKKRKEENSKLEIIYPKDGIVCIPSPIMTVAEQRSANNSIDACSKITEWFLSEEGQGCISKMYMHPVLKDVKDIPSGAKPITDILNKSIKINWGKIYKEKDKIINMFQKHIAVKNNK